MFWGFPQAVKDLKSAIIFADDHTLPIILFGHSMGGYAVSTVLADPEVKSHNISGVIEYSGFNDIKGVVRDFLGADNSLLKKFMAELICLGQFLIFGRMIYNKASDVVNAKSDVNFIMVHGTKDEEDRIRKSLLYLLLLRQSSFLISKLNLCIYEFLESRQPKRDNPAKPCINDALFH